MAAERGQERVGGLRCQNARQRARRAQERCPAYALASSGASCSQSAWDGIGRNSSITACKEIGEQPRNGRQATLDRPYRKPWFTILQPNDTTIGARAALGLQECEHIGRRHVRREL